MIVLFSACTMCMCEGQDNFWESVLFFCSGIRAQVIGIYSASTLTRWSISPAHFSILVSLATTGWGFCFVLWGRFAKCSPRWCKTHYTGWGWPWTSDSQVLRLQACANKLYHFLLMEKPVEYLMDKHKIRLKSSGRQNPQILIICN